MPFAKIKLKIHSRSKPHPLGMNEICWLFQANPGHQPKPISDIASGGEQSRLALAMRIISEQNQDVTIIFDEIDSGTGGSSAEKIGQLLKKTAKNNQIICITHSPTIAAMADHHLKVSKDSSKNNTIWSSKYLHNQDKVAEIARMISGSNSTKALEHAEAMINQRLEEEA